jgi:hypothetical protein
MSGWRVPTGRGGLIVAAGAEVSTAGAQPIDQTARGNIKSRARRIMLESLIASKFTVNGLEASQLRFLQ